MKDCNLITAFCPVQFDRGMHTFALHQYLGQVKMTPFLC